MAGTCDVLHMHKQNKLPKLLAYSDSYRENTHPDKFRPPHKRKPARQTRYLESNRDNRTKYPHPCPESKKASVGQRPRCIWKGGALHLHGNSAWRGCTAKKWRHGVRPRRHIPVSSKARCTHRSVESACRVLCRIHPVVVLLNQKYGNGSRK